MKTFKEFLMEDGPIAATAKATIYLSKDNNNPSSKDKILKERPIGTLQQFDDMQVEFFQETSDMKKYFDQGYKWLCMVVPEENFEDFYHIPTGDSYGGDIGGTWSNPIEDDQESWQHGTIFDGPNVKQDLSEWN